MNQQPQPPSGVPQAPGPVSPVKKFTLPSPGEVITSLATGNTYTIGKKIGEGNFGFVYACTDVWNNNLAVKVLKPLGTYEAIKASAEAELAKLRTLRNPYVTYVYDAFEFRDTFFIVTEKCQGCVRDLFTIKDFSGQVWLMPIARCLLQAVHYLHVNNYAHQDIHAGNVFTAIIKDELLPADRDAMVFKLGDLGVAKLLTEIDAKNTRAQWMLPPEVLNQTEYGPIDHRVDIYHTGLLLLELAYSKELRFTPEEIIKGTPRDRALALPSPHSFALEKALRRHTQFRTANAMELWSDLHAPEPQKK